MKHCMNILVIELILNMDERVAKELIAIRRAVKRKYQSLRSDITQAELNLEKQWKPITQPLKELVSVVKTEPNEGTVSKTTTRRGSTMFETEIKKKVSSTPIHDPHFLRSETIAESKGESPTEEVEEGSMSPNTWRKHQVNVKEVEKEIAQMLRSSVLGSYLEPFKENVKQYVEGLIHDTRDEYDTERGINLDLESNRFTMGNKRVDFRDDLFIIFDRNDKELIEYRVTLGLLELLFKKHPNYDIIDEGDKRMYNSILHHTSAHKRKYDPTEQVKGSRGKKYKSIIQHNVSYKKKVLVERVF